MMFCNLLLAAIPLLGVTGEKLKARAFFDANNVKVGDPLILTVDFIGTADFEDLHPPALSRYVSRKDWKLDDTSAKTQTESQRVGGFFSSREVTVARRLTYRVRPRREGVLWFPKLEFEYDGKDGRKMRVVANEIPVHAKPGRDVVVAEMGEDEMALPQPDALIRDPGVVGLTDDELFAWRKACTMTNADAFAQFDFPAAKLNEARLATLSGDWKRAMKVYSRLEWQTGQTPEIERGIVAALASGFQNPAAELPVWRQVGRPILKYGWKGRCGIVFGGIAGIVLVLALLGRFIRFIAGFALALAVVLPLSGNAQAQDPFAAMEQMMREQHRRMQQMMGGGGFSFSFGGSEEKPPEVKASLAVSNPSPKVGEQFDFIVSLEVPKGVTVEPSNFSASESYGLVFVTGRGEALADGVSSNSNNVLKRVSIPARYDVPYHGPISFGVSGMVTGRRSGGRRGSFSFSFSNSFEAKTRPVRMDVRPLSDAPADFSGIVASAVRLVEHTDGLSVGSNDVIVVHYELAVDGWLPEDWMPQGAAFECGREKGRQGGVKAEWRRYVVADGIAATPQLKVTYYDSKTKTFKVAVTGCSRIKYRKEKEEGK